jgi:hypothetical protein
MTIQIDREHSDYALQTAVSSMYRDLYSGGHQFTFRANRYLLRRQKEALDVYNERLLRVFYENYIGSIVDWYASTLFRREPSLHFEGGLDTGREFLAKFAGDCDRRGTKLSTFFRRCLIEALVVGKAHILIDFPRAENIPANRAEEDLAGLSRAFLVFYQAEELINWSRDESGDYEWVVIRHKVRRQPDANSPNILNETYWYYYNRTEYKIYKRVEEEGTEAAISLISEGLHSLAFQQRVPLVTLEVSDGMWLTNKAAQLQLEHFNKSNALAWATTMGLFAMPVVYSDREWNQILGESYYIQLGPNDRFGWTEPDGKVYTIAAAHLQTLKEEIYRVCYLSQASGEAVSGHAQSALSKQLDFTITKEVLLAYGSAIKECMSKVLRAISIARQDDVQVLVTGMDEVDITDFGTELQQATGLLQLGIDSPTLKRQIFQRLALKYLSDAGQETKDQIGREIEAQLTNK